MGVTVSAILFLFAALASALAVYAVRRAAPRLRLIDVPNERSLHNTPTPRGGGASIVVVCLAGLGIAWLWGIRPSTVGVGGYVAGAVLLAAVSLTDDIRQLPAGLRLVVQVLAALLMAVPIVLAAGVGMPAAYVAIAVLVIVLWSVGLTNAFNFMDGIDGLIGAQGVVIGVAWALLATINGLRWEALLALLVCGSSLGFLTQNWHPARVFLGDVGSAFLGFTFAFLSTAVPRHPVQFVAAVVVVWPLLIDASVTLLRRLKRKENLFAAHRSHLYQRAVLAGVRPPYVAALYALCTVATAAAAAVLWTADSLGARLLVALVVIVESIGLIAFVRRVES